MKQLIFLALIVTSCTKEAILEPIKKEPGKIETRDLIDQNFFESQPKIIIQYCPDGSYCVEAVNPIPKGNFETTYTYEWGFVRCQGCGSDSVKGKVATFKALKGTNIVLIVQGFRTGTNIKSDFLKTEIEI